MDRHSHSSERKARLDRRPALRAVQNTDFLQAVTLLATRERRIEHKGVGVTPAISCKRRHILRLTKDEYVRWADPVTEALEWAAQFLALEHVFRADDVPYRTQLVPLSAIRVALGGAAVGYGVSDKLRQWFWCGVLGELYGGTTRDAFRARSRAGRPVDRDGRLAGPEQRRRNNVPRQQTSDTTNEELRRLQGDMRVADAP